jgi:chemotaxis protein MotB
MFMPKIRFISPAVAAIALLLAACSPTPPPPPPAPPPAPPPVPGPQSISERSVLTMAADLAFGKGSYMLTKSGKAKLAALVPALQGAGGKVVVYGYTDNTPVAKALAAKGIADNLDLSSKRANEVVRFLISKGIDPNIISGKGRGDTHPVAENDTPKGRAQNRRIEVVVEQPAG